MAKKEKISGKKIKNTWHIDEKSFKEYLKARLNEKKAKTKLKEPQKVDEKETIKALRESCQQLYKENEMVRDQLKDAHQAYDRQINRIKEAAQQEISESEDLMYKMEGKYLKLFNEFNDLKDAYNAKEEYFVGKNHEKYKIILKTIGRLALDTLEEG